MQIYKINGYNVPWANTPTARPVFTTMALLNNYLGYCYTGYTFTTQGDVNFHPAQETLILRTDGTPASITALRRINYIGVECQLTGEQNARPTTYETLYYFVDEIIIQPIFGNEPVTAVAKIRPDGWTTYGAPRNRVLLNNGAIVEQSTPFDNLVGGGSNLELDIQTATTPLYPDPPAPDNPTDFIYAPAVLHGGRTGKGVLGAADIVGGYPQDAASEYFFVGLFTDGDGRVYALGRPLSENSETDATLAQLTTVVKIAYAGAISPTYRYDPETLGGDILVDLYAAYVVPKTFALSQMPSWEGYAIKKASGLYEDGYLAFRLLDISGAFTATALYVPLSLTWSDLHYGSPTPTPPNKTAFLDIGTAYNRLQVPVNEAGSKVFAVRFFSTFSTSGFSLIMEVGGQSVDIGGDFAVAVPGNTKAEFFAKNKWSMALQGVASVGGIIASAASANPVAFVGATLSAGQFAANISQAVNAPATVQGQGNGSAVYNISNIAATSYGQVTRGAIYLRYYFGENSLEWKRVVKRYGYKWKHAIVHTSSELSKEIFGNGASIQHPKRRYIKVVNPEVIFSTNTGFSVGETAYVPTWARDEINEILTKGVLLYYDPDPDEPADSEYGFGA